MNTNYQDKNYAVCVSMLSLASVTPSIVKLFPVSMCTNNNRRIFGQMNFSIYLKCEQQLKDPSAVADGDVRLSGSYKPQPPWRLHSWRRPRWSHRRSCCSLWKEHFIQAGWTRLLYNPTQHAGTTQKLSVDQLWVFSSFRHHVSD